MPAANAPNLFPPETPEPLAVYPTERWTCLQFSLADAPERVHHAVIIGRRPQDRPRPCASCGQAVSPAQGLYACAFCRQDLCAPCLAKDGYAPQGQHHLATDLERRDFLIREMKEQAFNLQQGQCGQCRRRIPGIEQASILRGPQGPWLLCDRPCAAAALGLDQTPPPGTYPGEHIRLVADPRHGEPQDWLNVHYEIEMPQHSDEVWSQADCRFAASVSADPRLWEFRAQCLDCGLPEDNCPPRPHKWCRAYFALRPRPDGPTAALDPLNAQSLLMLLGRPEKPHPLGLTLLRADPGCRDYYGLPG